MLVCLAGMSQFLPRLYAQFVILRIVRRQRKKVIKSYPLPPSDSRSRRDAMLVALIAVPVRPSVKLTNARIPISLGRALRGKLKQMRREVVKTLHCQPQRTPTPFKQTQSSWTPYFLRIRSRQHCQQFRPRSLISLASRSSMSSSLRIPSKGTPPRHPIGISMSSPQPCEFDADKWIDACLSMLTGVNFSWLTTAAWVTC